VLAAVALTPIGVVRTPFADHAGMPIQTVAAQGVRGTIELDPAYEPGLADLGGFTHLHLITYLHRTGAPSLRVTPYLDTSERGIFATRSPRRPNAIGLSLVRLVAIEGAVLHIEEVDLLDGTPLLDIKPYVPPFDDRPGARYGWFEQRAQHVHSVRADARFAEPTTEEA
jgi:tRNA (adenine37-N6)-methyltransferase